MAEIWNRFRVNDEKVSTTSSVRPSSNIVPAYSLGFNLSVYLQELLLHASFHACHCLRTFPDLLILYISSNDPAWKVK